MKQKLLSAAIGAVLLGGPVAAQAIVLSLDTGNLVETDNSPNYIGALGNACTAGSCWGYVGHPGGPAPDYFGIWTNIYGVEGIRIGETQIAGGEHTGAPNGSETPTVDAPFLWGGHTGMHSVETPITILSQSGNSMDLDFSGWDIRWGGPLTLGQTNGDFLNFGTVTVTCGLDCSVGDTWMLDDWSTALFPFGDTAIRYRVVLRGTIEASPVPLPPAAALLLAGLPVICRRRRKR